MNRRQFCFAFSGAVALLAGARPGRAECGSSGIIEFINTVWQKQARLLAAQTPPSEEEYYALFSRGMRTLMQDAIEKAFKGITDVKQARAIAVK